MSGVAVSARPAARGRRVRVETGESATTLFDERWDALVRAQPLPNPTLSALWLRHLLELEPGEPVSITVEQDGVVLAAGAFGLYRPAGRAGPTFARWLGGHRQWFSPELLVEPSAPGAGAAVFDALLGVANVVHLPAPEGGAAATALRARAASVSELTGADGWTTPLPPPGLEKALKLFREDLRRATRLGAEVTVETVSDAEQVLGALERLFVLHAERWRALGGEIARFSGTDALRAWHRRVLAEAAAHDGVRIAEVREDGNLVASCMALSVGSGAVGHTTAIRPGGKLRRPGHAAQLHLLLALEAAGVEEIDLGTGACAPGSPKATLGPTRVAHTRLVACGSVSLRRLATAALGASDRWQRRARSIRALRRR